LNICIDARSLGQKGIYSYANSLLNSLMQFDDENKYLIIKDASQESWCHKNFTEINVPSSNPGIWYLWSNTYLPRLLSQKKIDIYHSFKHVTAYFLKQKRVLTLHGGPMLYRFPEFYTWYDRAYWKISYRTAIRFYDRIIATANAESDFFVERFGIPEDKFRVVHLAGDERFGVIKNQNVLEDIKNKYNLPDHFILFLGRIHPQKNLEGIINGYHKAKDRIKPYHKLVIVGGKSGSYFQKIYNLIIKLGIQDDIIFLGHIASDDVPVVYNLARLFLFPSKYENWGIVLLEAMACGLPVVTSNIHDIDDVVGDSAVRADPHNADAIASAIVKVMNSPELRRSLEQQSLVKAASFSWRRCALETLNVYRELFESA